MGEQQTLTNFWQEGVRLKKSVHTKEENSWEMGENESMQDHNSC